MKYASPMQQYVRYPIKGKPVCPKGILSFATVLYHGYNIRQVMHSFNPDKHRSAVILMMNFFQLVIYFTICSFLGWVVETLFCSLQTGHFVFRGFLAGPVCPIYGFGSLIVMFLLLPFSENILLVYVIGVIVMTALEYFVSFLLEKLFKKSFWDYSNHRYNINGRVNLIYSLLWGLLCILVVYFVYPAIKIIIDRLSGNLQIVAAVVILVLFASDILYSVRDTLVFNRELLTLTAIAERIEKIRADMIEAAEEKKARLEEDMTPLLGQLEERARRFFRRMRRILNAFPKMRMSKKDRLSVRERINAYRNRK